MCLILITIIWTSFLKMPQTFRCMKNVFVLRYDIGSAVIFSLNYSVWDYFFLYFEPPSSSFGRVMRPLNGSLTAPISLWRRIELMLPFPQNFLIVLSVIAHPQIKLIYSPVNSYSAHECYRGTLSLNSIRHISTRIFLYRQKLSSWSSVIC